MKLSPTVLIVSMAAAVFSPVEAHLRHHVASSDRPGNNTAMSQINNMGGTNVSRKLQSVVPAGRVAQSYFGQGATMILTSSEFQTFLKDGDKKVREKFCENALKKAYEHDPTYNYLIVRDYIWRKSSRSGEEPDVLHLECGGKLGMGSYGYKLAKFKKGFGGWFRKNGDGGYINWRFKGNWNRDGDLIKSSNTLLLSGWKRFKNNLGRNYCMDLKSANAANGNGVQLYHCNGTPAQSWYLDSAGRIHSGVDYNKCLEAGKRGGLYDKMFVWECHNGMHQRWSLQSDGRIRNKAYEKYIGVASGCSGVSSGKRLELHNKITGGCASQQRWII